MTHVCTLEGEKLEELGRPQIPQNANKFRKFKWILRNSCLPSNKNPRTHSFFCSTGAVIAETKRHLNSNYSYMIHPFSDFRFVYQYNTKIIINTTL